MTRRPAPIRDFARFVTELDERLREVERVAHEPAALPIAEMQERIRQLEAEVAALRASTPTPTPAAASGLED